jgi:putative ABC transport system permease protein
MSDLKVLRRVTGIGIAGNLALALLVGGCVLAATGGPRQAQAMGTRALAQTLDRVPPLGKVIVASSNWAVINDAFGVDYGPGLDLGPAELADATTQLRRDFTVGPLRLAPESAGWVAMTSAPYPVASTLPALKGLPAKVEVADRDQVAGRLRLVAGRMPGAANGGQAATELQVAVTSLTAARFGLRPGSQLPISVPSHLAAGQYAQITLQVTGIVEPTEPGSTFWRADPLLPRPALNYEAGGSEVWVGAVIAGPSEVDQVQSIFGYAGLDISWNLPVAVAGLHGQAQALSSAVSQVTNRNPALTGRLAPMANALSVTSGLVQPMAALVQAASAVNALLWILYVGLAVAGLVMLLLAARMIAGRRSAELSLERARGASLRQLFLVGCFGALVVCGPAAALTWAAAVLLIPGSAPAGPAAWWPGIATLVIAAAGPGVAAAWQHRLPRRVRRRRGGWATRVVFEVTAGIAAIGGIVVARTQNGTGDLYLSAAPVLIGVLAVIVVLRLYQVLLSGLARASAGRRGVIGFLGLTRAAHATITLALPAMTIVLAVTVAAFTGMVRGAVVRAETAASWQETGADVVLAAAPWQPGIAASVISSSAVRAITAVPGIQQAATALVIPLHLADGQVVTSIAVDPASYAALVASTKGYAPVNPALLARPRGQGGVPVLASPQAAADLGGQADSTIVAQQGLSALRVQVSGELRSTPALPGGGAFIVLPLASIRSISGSRPVNLILLTGPSIDLTRLRAAAKATTRGASTLAISTRSRALLALAGAPLQQGTFLLFALAIGFADALALAVILLELALGAADREPTMARLAAMGLTEAQRVRLAAFEVLPAIAACAVAAIGCAVALPLLVAPAINLSVFTQSSAQVPLRPDFESFGFPLAGLLVVTVIALAYEIRSGRGHNLAATVRAQ